MTEMNDMIRESLAERRRVAQTQVGGPSPADRLARLESRVQMAFLAAGGTLAEWEREGPDVIEAVRRGGRSG